MAWPLAVTFADKVILAGAVKLAPLEGEVSAMTGGARTVRRKFVVVQSDVSQTVSEIVAVPVWPEAGVTATDQFAPLLVKTIPLAGTKVGLEQAAETVRPGAGVCWSLTENASGPVPVFTLIVCAAIPVIDGGVFVTTGGAFVGTV